MACNVVGILYLVFCNVSVLCLRDTRVLSSFAMVKCFVKLVYDMGMILCVRYAAIYLEIGINCFLYLEIGRNYCLYLETGRLLFSRDCFGVWNEKKTLPLGIEICYLVPRDR